MATDLTLAILRKTDLSALVSKLILKAELTDLQRESLYRLSLMFLNQSDSRVREFGYKLIIKNSLGSENPQPLLQISLSLGYYPIVKLIDNITNGQRNNSFLYEWCISFLEEFHEQNLYLTKEQRELLDFYRARQRDTVVVTAPTSYGKSGLILNTIQANKDQNICIIVPTKALLSQTKMRILRSKEFSLDRKIITHPDMYQAADRNFIALVTQERLLRLLEQEENLKFGTVVIDEAHNLYNDDVRNRLLAVAISILHFRNTDTAFKFFSPFLVNGSNLKVRRTEYEIQEKKITEHLKINNYYCIDLTDDRQLYYYEQYLSEFIETGAPDTSTVFDFIRAMASEKNIVYLNRPPKLERFAKSLAIDEPFIASEAVEQACEQLANYLHKDYDLIECLKRGVVYHHGSVPDIIKLYIEALYAKEKRLKYIICSSTLLEGVNIPAETLFVLEQKKGLRKLSPSQFKNLAGRLARFSELFDKENRNIGLLEPNVYVIKSEFMARNANIKQFLLDSVKADKRDIDNLENVMLQNTELSEETKENLETEEDFLANFEPGIIPEASLKIAKTDIGQRCFKNQIREINILEKEDAMQRIVNQLLEAGVKANLAIELLNLIASVFIEHLDEDRDTDNLLRLQNREARLFYSMFLVWHMRSAPYSELIGRFMSYWDSLLISGAEAIVYAGKWGEIARSGRKLIWVNLREKTAKQRLNLAIVRIKEEQDFLENSIIKFVEVLNELNLIQEDLYKKIKYGTSDDEKILLIKNGYSSSLAKLILEKYKDFLTLDLLNGVVVTNSGIVAKMQENKENHILIFETEFNVKAEPSL